MNSGTKTWTKEEIRNLLTNSDKAVIRGLLRLYKFQTETEQESEETKYNNNLGFNGSDAKFLTSCVHFYEKYKYLSPKQILSARKKLLKYSGQLAKFANGEISESDVVEPVKFNRYGYDADYSLAARARFFKPTGD